MQSAASGLIEAFQVAFSTDGTDWDNLPLTGMYNYGGGGIGGWASLCGVPNGCVAALNLVGLHGGLGSDVMGYYSTESFPTAAVPDLYTDPYYGNGGTGGYTWTKQPIEDSAVLAHTQSYSPLCHISISKWCYEAGVHLGTMGPYSYQHKNDRCGKMCADMAAYTADLINNWALTGVSADPHSVSAATAACGQCHSKASTANGPATLGKMECGECHMPNTYHTTGEFYIDDLWTEDTGGNPKDTFTSGDTIVYKLRFAILGAGSFFVRTVPNQTGRIVLTTTTPSAQAFNNSTTCMSSVTIWSWSEVVPATWQTKGKFVVKLQIADTPTGPLLSEKSRQVFFNVV